MATRQTDISTSVIQIPATPTPTINKNKMTKSVQSVRYGTSRLVLRSTNYFTHINNITKITQLLNVIVIVSKICQTILHVYLTDIQSWREFHGRRRWLWHSAQPVTHFSSQDNSEDNGAYSMITLVTSSILERCLFIKFVIRAC